MKPFYEQQFKKLESFIIKNKIKIKMIILDGVLMPWSALGKGLIKSSFEPINIGINSEANLLEYYGFEQNYNNLINKYHSSDFDNDLNVLKKNELFEKYGHEYHNFKEISYLKNEYIPITKLKEYGQIL